MNLNELWNLYEADKRIQGFSPKTLKAYALQHKMLVLALGNLDVTGVTLSTLKEYLAKQAVRLKPNSLDHRIRFVRSLFLYAYEETYLTSNPSLKLREPKLDKRIPKFLIEEDIIYLKSSCQSVRERALLEFLYSTGCRVGELEKINIEDLNWENCSAIVNGKGSKQREVYFTTECNRYASNKTNGHTYD
ncbi:Tyrosine recombinase XerC [Paenibacillus auburnensis]|uniref:Tyrosine recombinase XerC n=1 Tax=Paenibacillus auburnensis TaxID=2905649 RepID=A0ABM9CT37_9BACL|nr:tyrosine-type recombinase/integrase [Paenibacillus auburnensis]CAH1223607.1 Tyrosine recombinase XerC [Paenibacillus auburnensis]